MKQTPTLALLALLVAAVPASAADVVLELDWSRVNPAELEPTGGTVVATDRRWSALRIVHQGSEPRLIPLARLADPGITANHYVVSGQVRYEDVRGNSYLEMWNVMPGGERFFSRTLAPAGPTGVLTGTSGWRPFALPADLQDSPDRPATLELNLALLGPGTVEIGPLTLTENSLSATGAAGAGTAWWNERSGGLIGGLGGAGLGLLAAFLGILLGYGRARAVVSLSAIVLLVTGLVTLAFGAIALFQSQPYAVYYPLLLLGGLTAVLMAALLVGARRRYRDLELRRMRAMDAL